MKKKIIHITAGLIFAAVTIIPSCELFEDCGECTLVSVDLDDNITYGTPQFVCGSTYQDYSGSVITETADGSYYWDCE